MKRNNLYLYLTMACFVGIITIFVFDGYIGLYDKLVMDNGQFTQTVEADQWSQQDSFGYLMSTNVDRDGLVDFTYEIDNRNFSSYNTAVNVSLWRNQEKIVDLKTETLAVSSFDKGEVTWSLKAADVVPADFPPDQNYNVNVIIKRDNIEREVIVYVNAGPSVPKPVAVPAPTR